MATQDQVLSPAKIPYAVTSDDSISSATAITLQAQTAVIEVQATDSDVYILYGTAHGTVSATNFHEKVQADTVRHYIRPEGIDSIQLIAEGTGGSVVVIEK